MVITGTAGNDTLTGTAQADTFDLSQGGDDTANGGAGDDLFKMGASFTSADSIDGGSGNDTLSLDGNYSGGHAVTFAATTLINVETITLGSGFSYKLVTNDATVAAKQTLTVDGGHLGRNDTLTFNGSAETNGHFDLIGGKGNDVLTGGALSDVFDLSKAGNDQVSGGGGDDIFSFGDGLAYNKKGALSVDGGAGNDTVTLDGKDYGGEPTLLFSGFKSIENIVFAAGHNYGLGLYNKFSDSVLNVDASALSSHNRVTFSAADVKDYALHVIGGAGNDTIFTGAKADTIDASLGGNDDISAGPGNDTIIMNGALTAADQINGGNGDDTVILNGQYYYADTKFKNTTFTNVEKLVVERGHSYSFTAADDTVASGQTMTIDGSQLKETKSEDDQLTFIGTAETHGSFHLIGGSGRDVLYGGASNDILQGNDGNDYLASGGGRDVIQGGAGNDIMVLGAYLTSNDKIDGGTGSDTLDLAGDYTAGLTLNSTNLTSIEKLLVDEDSGTNFSYNITTTDDAVAAGKTLTVTADLTLGHTLTFDGSAETDGRFVIESGDGNDTITTGAGNDVIHDEGGANYFDLSKGGNDRLSSTTDSYGGNDTIYMGAAFNAGDQIGGGHGNDLLILAGDYSAGVTMSAKTITLIETMQLTAGDNYKFTSSDGNVRSGYTLTIDAHTLAGTNSVTFDGAAETDGHFVFMGGAGADNFTGGALKDTFVYDDGVAFSGSLHDTIHAFDFSNDVVQFSAVNAIDPEVTTGTLSAASFNTDMANALAGHLNAGDAILFQPDDGDQLGKLFLIVDGNGTAGYQNGADLVLELDGALNTSNISTANFVA